jgi:hypothetical protein
MDNKIAESEKEILFTPFIIEGDWVTTEINSSVELQVLQLKNGNDTIPLNSPRVKLASSVVNKRFLLRISLQGVKRTDAFVIQVQNRHNPSKVWKLKPKLQNAKKLGEIDIEMPIVEHQTTQPNPGKHRHQAGSASLS